MITAMTTVVIYSTETDLELTVSVSCSWCHCYHCVISNNLAHTNLIGLCE